MNISRQEAKELKNQIIELHKSGMSYKEMARQVGRSKEAIVYHLKRLGLTRYRKRMTDQDKDVIWSLKRKSLKNTEIARMLGIPIHTIGTVVNGKDKGIRLVTNRMNQLMNSRWIL